uniref:Malic enzyme N-terminal domain-containing protein n=1 Tax=Cucumis sativus TaxID=3659 RepID=A0A0A0KTS3_CUCSA
MIALTDGSCILGLDDLRVQGIGIPTGNLDMYVAVSGINPQRNQESESFSVPCLEFADIFFPFQQVFLIVGILRVMLDIGSNNEMLLWWWWW